MYLNSSPSITFQLQYSFHSSKPIIMSLWLTPFASQSLLRPKKPNGERREENKRENSEKLLLNFDSQFDISTMILWYELCSTNTFVISGTQTSDDDGSSTI